MTMVFNAKYNFECQPVCEFLQNYVYKIKTKYDINFKSVLALTAQLNIKW